VVVNGGYFRREQGEFVPDGLIVSGGEAFGESYGECAGMFAVGAAGPESRWLKTKPYDPAEKLRAAVQFFPMLVKPGGETGFPAESADGIRARRTAVWQDRLGRIRSLVAAKEYFTLRRLSVYLHDSDFGLDVAMNLDGGLSSGMLVDEPRETVPAQTVLPIVIVIRAG
jgi:exopolysaccharide biosynthesis protein